MSETNVGSLLVVGAVGLGAGVLLAAVFGSGAGSASAAVTSESEALARRATQGLRAQGYHPAEVRHMVEQAWYELGREGFEGGPVELGSWQGVGLEKATRATKAALRAATGGRARRTLHGNAFAGGRR